MSAAPEAMRRTGTGAEAARTSPGVPRSAAEGDLGALALALLSAVDEGRPAGDPDRALALAVLASEAPGNGRWTAAVAVLEGGALRTRRAVMLADDVLGDEGENP